MFVNHKHVQASSNITICKGHPIWVCNKCDKGGFWMKTGIFSKPKPLIGDGFNALKEDWENSNGTKF